MSHKCFECESTENIHHHHVIPQSKGGTKTVPLCEVCHGKVHGIDFTNHGILTKEGLKRAKERGVKLGSPNNLTYSAKLKGVESIKMNRDNDPNWLICKEFIKDFIKVNGKINYTHVSNSLNEEGYRSSRGSQFTPTSVKRVYEYFFPAGRDSKESRPILLGSSTPNKSHL